MAIKGEADKISPDLYWPHGEHWGQERLEKITENLLYKKSDWFPRTHGHKIVGIAYLGAQLLDVKFRPQSTDEKIFTTDIQIFVLSL